MNTREGIKVDRPRCPFCHGELDPAEPKQGCEACLAWHHRECWDEHGACAACGAAGPAGTTRPAPTPGGGAKAGPAKGATAEAAGPEVKEPPQPLTRVPAWPTCREPACDRPAVWEHGLYTRRCRSHSVTEARRDVRNGLFMGLVVLLPPVLALAAFGHPAGAVAVGGLLGSTLLGAALADGRRRALADVPDHSPADVPLLTVPASAPRCTRAACQLPVWEEDARHCEGHFHRHTRVGITMAPFAAGLIAAAVTAGVSIGGAVALVFGGLLALGIAFEEPGRRRLARHLKAKADLDA